MPSLVLSRAKFTALRQGFVLVCAGLMFCTSAWALQCRAIDGDTVRCGKKRVRLRNVYAAERGTPNAEKQRQALQAKLDQGKVHIKRWGRDRYGRILADVYVDGKKIVQSDIGPRSGRGASSQKASTKKNSRRATAGRN